MISCLEPAISESLLFGGLPCFFGEIKKKEKKTGKEDRAGEELQPGWPSAERTQR